MFSYGIVFLIFTTLLTYGCKELPPGPIDTRVALLRAMWYGDASSSTTIGWSSLSEDAKSHRLHLDTVDHGTNADAYRQVLSVSLSNDAFGMTNNFVRLKDLQPATKYYFVISGSDYVSQRFWFETASNRETDRLSIIAGGDSRNNAEVRMKANQLVAKLRPHAVMFGGDYTANGTENEWKRWLQDWQLTIAEDGRITPIIPTRGNHERNNKMMVDLFDTPLEVYFATQLNGNLLRIYTLNTEISMGGNQTSWLHWDLHDNYGVRWKFAQYHQPMRPHTKGKKEGDNQYKNWAKIFYDYGMDLVSEADAHTVKTTWPLRPTDEPGNEDGFVRDDARGTIFIGEGCWGAPLRDNNDIRSWTRDHGKFNHFNWIFLDSRQMEVRTVKVDNGDEVAPLTDSTRFSMPMGIDLWSPHNGPVIRRNK